jgi:hypothetical protein
VSIEMMNDPIASANHSRTSLPNAGRAERRASRFPLLSVVLVLTMCGGRSEPVLPSGADSPPQAHSSATAKTSSSGILFGPFHLPADEFDRPEFTGAFLASRSIGELRKSLEMARSAGVSVIVTLRGPIRGRPRCGGRGPFSLPHFGSLISRFAAFDFEPYVRDGTVIGLVLFDEPHNRRNWDCDEQVPFAAIESAAARAKERWPSVPIGVWAPPRWIAKGAPWEALDFVGTNYTPRRGDVEEWRDEQVATARELNLGLILNMGISQSDPTAPQLRAWGTALLSSDYVCGVTMWRWGSFKGFDFDRWSRDPAVSTVFGDLATMAREHSPTACRR